MQVSLVGSEPESFKPITITLTIESKQELLELWHRLDLSVKEVQGIAMKSVPYPGVSLRGFWQVLNTILEVRI